MKLKVEGFNIIIESNTTYGNMRLTSITPSNSNFYDITPSINSITKNGISIEQSIYDIKTYMDDNTISFFPVCNITSVVGLILNDYITRLPIILPSYHLYDMKYFESKLFV